MERFATSQLTSRPSAVFLRSQYPLPLLMPIPRGS
jgi:hypothetical protein